MAEEDKKQQMKTFNTVRVPMALVPVYVVLFLQFIGVVFMAGVLWTKLEYQTQAIQKLEIKIEKVVDEGLNDRYRGADAERDFSKVYGTIGSLSKEIKETQRTVELLEFRVRHFQAQFPKKERLP